MHITSFPEKVCGRSHPADGAVSFPAVIENASRAANDKN